jgi:glutamyl-tRNA reductase
LSEETETQIWDFGFSLVSEDELKRAEKDIINKKTNQLTDTQRKLIGLKKMIWPLLEHLKQDPMKNYIFWPRRTEKIDEFMKKIEEYVNSEE